MTPKVRDHEIETMDIDLLFMSVVSNVQEPEVRFLDRVSGFQEIGRIDDALLV